MAAASIGQVHRAVLPNGRRVAVKVQRPRAPQQVESDIQLLDQAARLVRERVRALDFLDTREIVDEFARSIRQELDYRQEGRNADAFHVNFAGHPHVAVPRVYWSYTRARVLTMEHLDGVQLSDLVLDEWLVEQRRRLAYIVADAWMTMIFKHGFFHGDPHPANILVLAPERIGLVDFGLCGQAHRPRHVEADAALHRRDERERRGAAQAARRPRRALPARARGGVRLRAAARCTRATTARRLREIDPLQVIREAFALIYAMNIRLPTRFVLLDKAIATVGSVGVDLYPDFNVFEVARPHARALMIERFTPRRVLGRARREAWQLATIAAELPYQIHDTLEQVRDGQIEVGFVHKGLDDFMHKLDALMNRLVIALVVDRRPDRLEPDRHLRDDRPAHPRRARPLGDRLPRLGRARRVAALGRDPLRPPLSDVPRPHGGGRGLIACSRRRSGALRSSPSSMAVAVAVVPGELAADLAAAEVRRVDVGVGEAGLDLAHDRPEVAGGMPWAATARTSVAATVPVTRDRSRRVPGRARGLPPPPQKKNETPPFTFGCPKWTCAIWAGLLRFE